MERYLSVACGVAMLSDCRYKHGAVVVRHGRILGVSTNRTKNDPRYVDHRFSSIHAEIGALKRAGFPRKATVYVARVNNQGDPRMSKPCANCQEVLDSFRCKVVWTETGKWEK